MQKAQTIGMVYAICDHFEKGTGGPITASTLKIAAGVDRKQLRRWVRDGRLAEYTITGGNGQVQIAYSRPKTTGRGISDEETAIPSQKASTREEEIH